MKFEADEKLESYLREAETWAEDRRASDWRSRRLAWWIAGGASFIAIAEAIALAMLAPIKTVEPYTLLVDRQTGYVEALKPLERQLVAPDAALTRSFLVQYVIARESFDRQNLRTDYRKTALWSGPGIRGPYVASMQGSNPASPLAVLPRNARIEVEIKSVSSLGPSTSLVRFRTRRSDIADNGNTLRDWAAVIGFRWSGEAMSVEDRLINPLGFQVIRYRRDAEIIPTEQSLPSPVVDRQGFAPASGQVLQAVPPGPMPAQSATIARRAIGRASGPVVPGGTAQ